MMAQTITPARVLYAAVVVSPTVIINIGSYRHLPRVSLIGFLTLTSIVGWRLFCLLGESRRCQERLTPPTPQQEMMLQHFTQADHAKPVESEQARATRLKLEWSGL